ncbi:flagellar motor switch protein FliN [Acetobacter fabarum]|jgi:flagellar motor switch protein FliN/FliY|uniref:Flagellar motor switch protein FliN n=1 Tax=Acetobacter fabarum TaxID=483199 RepID=A0A269XZD8_9PROT|nr:MULTISPECIES: flagellar motor switch protein FliN [Acetobacter]MCH4025124.1 flagellar motor switch protein FliN [Acetobacter fabarum]MCH4055506.1 flagellar motor switch protein FliN [Acetobacter fabarum]MCH4127970.1 flagellar motor switch protein FliN [Acetobacter fabarum]MCH4141181.1 flagellar motor switch protein FliN [Acetobacter fabarum]MCI1243519.1 flagellar motor switch protein FliN [Acetobacter fabarum]
MTTENTDIGLEDFATSAPAPDASATAAPGAAPAADGKDVDDVQKEAVYDIPVKITAVIGTATMPVNQLLRLGRGAVVELDRKLGEAVDIYANNRLIARGEVVVVDDNHIGVTMTEILSSSATNG